MGVFGVLALDNEKIDNCFATLMVQNDLQIDTLHLPDELVALLESLPTEKRALGVVALLSQYRQMMLLPMPDPTGTISKFAPLPVLALPAVPSQFHHLIERILSEIGRDGDKLMALLRLLKHYGYSIAPTIWLPNKNFADGCLDDAIATLYMPWCLWQNAHQTCQADTIEITADNWDEWYPAQRRQALKSLRQSDPNLARSVMQACLANETAEERFKIVQILTIALSHDDQAFLATLSADRSQKVAKFANQLLSRLGLNTDDKQDLEDIGELDDYFVITKDNIRAKKTNNNKQKEQRTQKLATVNIKLWAKQHGLTTGEFISRWHFGHNSHTDNVQFVGNVLNYLDDDEFDTLAKTVMVYLLKTMSEFELWHLLCSRLSVASQMVFVKRLLQKDRRFAFWLNFCPDILELDFKTLSQSTPWQTLCADIKKQQEKADSYFLEYLAQQDCTMLGLLVAGDMATKILTALIELGVAVTDPALHTLSLNAKLFEYPSSQNPSSQS